MNHYYADTDNDKVFALEREMLHRLIEVRTAKAS